MNTSLESGNSEEGKDAARYRHIKNKYSSFIVMYYGSRIWCKDLSRRNVLTGELDALIDADIAEGLHKNNEGDPDLPEDESAFARSNVT